MYTNEGRRITFHLLPFHFIIHPQNSKQKNILSIIKSLFLSDPKLFFLILEATRKSHGARADCAVGSRPIQAQEAQQFLPLSLLQSRRKEEELIALSFRSGGGREREREERERGERRRWRRRRRRRRAGSRRRCRRRISTTSSPPRRTASSPSTRAPPPAAFR